jgi:hypothetical protein
MQPESMRHEQLAFHSTVGRQPSRDDLNKNPDFTGACSGFGEGEESLVLQISEQRIELGPPLLCAQLIRRRLVGGQIGPKMAGRRASQTLSFWGREIICA